MSELKRLVGLRVFNQTRSCILMKQFKGTLNWTIPMTTMTEEELDPLSCISRIIARQLHRANDFELVSTIAMINWKEEVAKDMTVQSFVYDLKYQGKVYPTLVPGQSLFEKSQWMQKGVIGSLISQGLTFPTRALVMGMEKEECLK